MTSSSSAILPFALAGSVMLAVSYISTPASAQPLLSSGLEFELGAGLLVAPSYEGSSDYQVSAYPVIGFGYLALDNGFTLGGGDGQGFSVRPSFRYLAAREAKNSPALMGLTDTDAAVELGGGFKYTFGSASAFADVRYGITGHNGFVGELGADYILHPAENTTVTAGPRVSWASNNYMDEYFSVSAAEASASGFVEFDAGPDLKSIGFEAAVRYEFNENWAVESGAGYNRLVGDAASSPTTNVGSKNQYMARIGLVRKFRIDF